MSTTNVQAARSVSPAAEFWRTFRRNKIALAALVVVLVIIVVAVFAPFIVPQDPFDLKSLVLRDARRPPATWAPRASFICSERTVRGVTSSRP